MGCCLSRLWTVSTVQTTTDATNLTSAVYAPSTFIATGSLSTLSLISEDQATSDLKVLISSPSFDKFTLFPRLPIELRLEIFEHAVPTGPEGARVITVKGIYGKRGLDGQLHMYFVPGDNLSSASIRNYDMWDIGLSRACWVSRQVYLKANPHSLPMIGLQQMRFNGNLDTVYIENFDRVCNIQQITDAWDNNSANPFLPWSEPIRALAVPMSFHAGITQNAFAVPWFPNLRDLVTVAMIEYQGIRPGEEFSHFLMDPMQFYWGMQAVLSEETVDWLKQYKQEYPGYHIPQSLVLERGYCRVL